MFGPDFLAVLFAASFWFGAAATILGFVFGFGRHGSFHVPHVGHVSAPHVGHVGAHGATGVSPFNVSSILAFLVVFGAVGLALQGGVGGVLALAFALLAGLIAGIAAFFFVARVLVRGETYLVDEPLAGAVGKVSIRIAGDDRVGEVVYVRNGVRRSDGARSVDGRPIERGEDIVILSSRDGIALVQRWSEYLNEAPSLPVKGRS